MRSSRYHLAKTDLGACCGHISMLKLSVMRKHKWHFLWPPNRAGHSAPIVSIFFFFLLFLAYSQRSEIGCLPCFHTWCGLSANLECTSEMCCTRLPESTGCKNLPSAHHRTTLSGYICATKACVNNRKNLLNSNISCTYPHNMVNFGPLMAEIGW